MVACGFSASTVSPLGRRRTARSPPWTRPIGIAMAWAGARNTSPRYGWIYGETSETQVDYGGSRFVGWQSVKDELRSILQAGWWLKLKHSCLWRHWCSVWRRQEGPTAQCLTVSLWTVCMFLFLHDIVFNLSLRTFLKQKRLEISLVEQPFSSGIFYVNLMISSWQRALSALLHSQQQPPIIGAANL